MSAPAPAQRPHRRRRLVVRALLSLVVAAAIGLWLLTSLGLAVLRCDESCGSGQAEHWRYPAQLAVAAVGGVLGLGALVVGFTSRTTTARWLLNAAVVCAAVWVGWVFGGGEF